MSMEEKIKDLMALRRTLERDRDRASANGHWDKVIRFALPQLSENPQPIFSTEGQLYTRQATEALQGWAYGANIDWLRLCIKEESEEDAALNQNKDVIRWCQQVAAIITDKMADSDFYSEALLFSEICFNLSTSIMYIDWNREDSKPIYTTLDPRDCLIRFSGHTRNLSLLIHEQKMTRYDAIDIFGDKCPDEIRSKIGKETWRFLHVVAHIPTYELTGIKGRGDWADFYLCEDLLKDMRYKPLAPRRLAVCPVAIWRFKRNVASISSWGCGSPGEIAITDLISINNQAKSNDILTQRIAEPPIKATNGLRNINLRPSGVTFLSGNEDYSFVQFNANGLTGIQQNTALKQDRLQDVYYVKFFLIFQQTLMSGQRTATEASLLDDEKTQNMSSFASNINTQFLEPLIAATYELLLDNAILPPPPESIQGKEIKIDFVSQLTVAQQRAAIVTPFKRVLSTMLEIAQVDQTVLKKVDFSKAFDIIARIENLNADMIVDDQEYKETVQALEQAALKQQEFENQLNLLNGQSNAYRNYAVAPQEGSPMQAEAQG